MAWQDDESSDSTGAPTAAQVPKLDNALELLVENLTEEFGFVPRDTYCGVFNLPQTIAEHNAALDGFNCSKLEHLVDQFTKHCNFEVNSNYLIAIHPIQHYSNVNKWEVDFKSVRITQKAMLLMMWEDES